MSLAPLHAAWLLLALGAPPCEPRVDEPAAREPRAGEPDGPGLAIRAAKVLTSARNAPAVVDHGVVLVSQGRIERVGSSAATAIPAGYVVLDAGERWVVPGFIDLHCHVAGPELFQGKNDINDMVYLANPGLRVVPSVIPAHADLERGVAGGVTTVLYIPGSGTNMGGQGVLLKTAFERYEEALLRFPGSLKLAQAGNPERWGIGVGRSFMNWNTRNVIQRGKTYAQAWEAHAAGRGPEPETSLELEIFRHLFAHETQISVHTQIYQVVLTTVTMLSGEFGLHAYIDHGEFDGYKVAPLAEAAGMPAIIGPRVIATTYPYFVDTDGQILGLAGQFQRLGHTRIGFNTDSPIVPEENLPLQAAMGTRYGFDNSMMDAVRGLTIVPAEAAGIDDRVGSLEPGKHADLFIADGNPIDPRTSVERVFIEGRLVYDATTEPRRF